MRQVDAGSVAGSEEYDACNDLAVLPDGRVTVTGTFGGPARFGALSTQPLGERDAFVALLSSAGKLEWIATGGSPMSDEARSIAVTPEAIFITGSFGGHARFGEHRLALPGPPVRTANPSNAFVVRYSLRGDAEWARSFGAADQFDRGWSLAALSDGGVAVAGDHASQMFLARFAPNGDLRWSQVARGLYSTARALVALPGDDLLVATYFGIPQGDSQLELHGTAAPRTLRSASSATALARYSATGELLATGVLTGRAAHSLDTRGDRQRDGSEVDVTDLARSSSGRLAITARVIRDARVEPGDLFLPTDATMVSPSFQDTGLFVFDEQR